MKSIKHLLLFGTLSAYTMQANDENTTVTDAIQLKGDTTEVTFENVGNLNLGKNKNEQADKGPFEVDNEENLMNYNMLKNFSNVEACIKSVNEPEEAKHVVKNFIEACKQELQNTISNISNNKRKAKSENKIDQYQMKYTQEGYDSFLLRFKLLLQEKIERIEKRIGELNHQNKKNKNIRGKTQENNYIKETNELDELPSLKELYSTNLKPLIMNENLIFLNQLNKKNDPIGDAWPILREAPNTFFLISSSEDALFIKITFNEDTMEVQKALDIYSQEITKINSEDSNSNKPLNEVNPIVIEDKTMQETFINSITTKLKREFIQDDNDSIIISKVLFKGSNHSTMFIDQLIRLSQAEKAKLKQNKLTLKQRKKIEEFTEKIETIIAMHPFTIRDQEGNIKVVLFYKSEAEIKEIWAAFLPNSNETKNQKLFLISDKGRNTELTVDAQAMRMCSSGEENKSKMMEKLGLKQNIPSVVVGDYVIFQSKLTNKL